MLEYIETKSQKNFKFGLNVLAARVRTLDTKLTHSCVSNGVNFQEMEGEKKEEEREKEKKKEKKKERRKKKRRYA